MKKLSLILLTTPLFALSGFAASAASDTASDAAYAPTWADADNGGTGFGAWTLATTGDGGTYIGGTGQGPDSFGFFANDGTSTAARDFTGGALSVGDTFSVDLGHTTGIASGIDIGINLLDDTSTVFTLKFVGDQSDWLLNDGGTDFGAGQAYAADISISFTFTYEGGVGNNSYSYTFGTGGTGSGTSFTATSTLSNITGFQLFNNGQGAGENFGANNLSVVPEPGTFALIAGIFGMVFVAMKRRNS